MELATLHHTPVHDTRPEDSFQRGRGGMRGIAVGSYLCYVSCFRALAPLAGGVWYCLPQRRLVSVARVSSVLMSWAPGESVAPAAWLCRSLWLGRRQPQFLCSRCTAHREREGVVSV